MFKGGGVTLKLDKLCLILTKIAVEKKGGPKEPPLDPPLFIDNETSLSSKCLFLIVIELLAKSFSFWFE